MLPQRKNAPPYIRAGRLFGPPAGQPSACADNLHGPPRSGSILIRRPTNVIVTSRAFECKDRKRHDSAYAMSVWTRASILNIGHRKLLPSFTRPVSASVGPLLGVPMRRRGS